MRKVWPFSFYFLYFAALAAFMPFLVLFYQDRGLSGGQIGVLTSLFPLVTLLAAPLWTGLADARRIHLPLMALSIAGAAVLVLLFDSLRSFGAMLLVIPLFAFFFAPVVAFSDSATISTLAAEGRPDLYGRVRIGGTIGWALSAPIAGALVEANGLKAAWWTYAGLMGLGLLVALRFRFPAVSARPSLLAGLRTIRADRKWLYFLGMCLVAGMGFTAVNSFLYAYMQQIGASASLMGLSLTLSTISEVPVMLFGHRLLARFGARGLFVLAVAATGVRLLLYAVFATPAGVLGFQLMNGLTFPMAWIAGVAWANENAPRHMESTAQGVFGATVTGVGATVGGLLAGILFGAIGGQGMFYVFGALVLTGLAVLSLLERGVGAKVGTSS